MKSKSLTLTQEDYLRAIYMSQAKGRGAGTSKIAQYLGLSKSTVSERLKELARQKLVTPSFYSEVVLTAKGRKIAEKLTYKHRIAEVFLNTVLKMPKDQVHAEAHKLEHALSDSVVKKLAAFLGKPKLDPHGSTIPRVTGGSIRKNHRNKHV